MLWYMVDNMRLCIFSIGNGVTDMKFKLITCFVVGFVLSGCLAGRVVDNRYEAAGGSYVVSGDMEYVGEVPKSYLEGCDGPGCTVINTVTTRTVEDLFVRAEDGKVKEFVLIGYKRITGKYVWMPLDMGKIDFAGTEFVEFFDYLEPEGGTDPYLSLLADLGYEVDGDLYTVRSLLKNENEKIRVSLQYGCSENMLPDKSKVDEVELQTFLRQKMAERILVPGS